MRDIDKDIDIQARKIALQLQSLMAVVDFKYNRHEPCLVCHRKFMHHYDGLPCDDDDNVKQRAEFNNPINTKEKARKFLA